jgi:hypothetical protein
MHSDLLFRVFKRSDFSSAKAGGRATKAEIQKLFTTWSHAGHEKPLSLNQQREGI